MDVIMRRMKQYLSASLAAIMLAGTLAGCGGNGNQQTQQTTKTETNTNSNSSTGTTANQTNAEPVTIKFLHKGPKPDGWDAVYEKYLEETKDTLNIELDITWIEHADYKEKLNLEITSGSEWDLVFDAPWVQLRNLAPEGYYADLSGYFNNPSEYPGLAKAFSAETMESNVWFDSMCYIPLYEAYGNGIPLIWYRKDWAKEWGVGTDGNLNSYDDMEAYWQAALDSGKIPYVATQARGFFQQLSIRGEVIEGPNGNSRDAGIQLFSSAGLSIWTYIENNELKAYAVEGQGDEAFADFPEGWQYDFAAERFETFARWQEAGYIDPDSLSCNDAETPFANGLAASFIGTLDDYVKVTAYEDTLGEDAVGFFIYVDSIREKEAGAIPVDYSGNNGLAVPANSPNIEATMRFLDWLFGSQEAHDLFQLGIEGKDFEYGDGNTYTTLTNYSADFGGYGWTWNPNYALISTAYDDEALEYRKYEYDASTFSSMPVLGFHFDTTDIDLSTAVAQCTAVTDMIKIVKLHGIKTDGNGVTYETMKDMLKANTDMALENGGQVVVDALIAQLREFLASK